MLQLRHARALLGLAGSAMLIAAVPAAAQGSYSNFDESASTALARYVRTLATSPRDFQALIGAGRAALAVGDTEAAAGFFARADDVNPRSPLPQAGMGAVAAATGNSQAALGYFVRAQQLGATVAQIACDRGLAFDLMGRQADAQSDYRIALNGPDAEETRRRLALSFAISGDRAGALATLSPLIAKGDPAAARTRAFVLALTGDTQAAMAAFDAAMPGSWSRISPFLQRLPSLAAGQKAAAANLGIFNDGTAPAMASAQQPAFRPPVAAPTRHSRADRSSGDRLADIDALLRGAVTPTAAAPQMASVQPQVYSAPQPQMVSYTPSPRQPRPMTTAPHKIWLQLASGANPTALPAQFQRLKSRNRELFDGITGYVAQGPDRVRLVIGPFRSASDADTLAQDLRTVDVNAFKWTNGEADQITPIGT